MRAVAILGLVLLLGACQGPALGDALANRGAPPTADAEDRPAADTPEGLRAFLAKGSESGRTPVTDMDRAIDAVLDAEARGRARSPRPEPFGCDGEDALDRFACERGMSRDAARQFWKNRRYTNSEKARKSQVSDR